MRGAPWLDAYRTYLATLTLGRLRLAGLVVAVLALLDGAFELVGRPRAFWGTFTVRLVTVSVALAVFVLIRFRAVGRAATPLLFVLLTAVAVDAESAILLTGGLDSPYYAGHLLLLVGTGLLLPVTLPQMTAIATLVWSVYLAPPVLMGMSARPGSVATHLFFLLSGTLIALVASRTTAELRRREFQSRCALEEEQRKSERLLLNVLPPAIAERLKAGEVRIADSFDEATVLFADLVGFTPLSDRMPPGRLVELLNRLFSEFDAIAERYGLEKIKTIGDAYMVAAGVPERRDDHVEAAAEMALELCEVARRFQGPADVALRLRVGLHTGPLVAGVIGTKKFAYDLWGDTVNTASRMESHGIPGMIHVTEAIHARLKDRYELEARGTISVKGKGQMVTFLLKGRKAQEAKREGGEG